MPTPRSSLQPSASSNRLSRNSSFAGKGLRSRGGSSTFQISGGAHLFPRPQRVVIDEDGQEQGTHVLVSMVPQYEYVLLYGTATYVESKTVVKGPALLRTNDSVKAEDDADDPVIVNLTWVKFSSDSWLVALPKYDTEFDGNEDDEDDARGTPLAGGPHLIDYSIGGLDNSFQEEPSSRQGSLSFVFNPRKSFSQRPDTDGDGSRLSNLFSWGRKKMSLQSESTNSLNPLGMRKSGYRTGEPVSGLARLG